MTERQVTNSMSQAEMEAYWRGAERERIMTLIEANVCNIYGEFCAPEDVCMSREALISLIGGEQK